MNVVCKRGAWFARCIANVVTLVVLTFVQNLGCHRVLLFEGRKSLFCSRSIGGTFAGTCLVYRITLTVYAEMASLKFLMWVAVSQERLRKIWHEMYE